MPSAAAHGLAATVVKMTLSASSTAALQLGFLRTGWSIDDLWLAVLGIGGVFRRRDVEGITSGGRSATPAEHDLLAAALNDYFVDHHQNHPVPNWRDLP
jgi:hypothetical protein